MYPHGQLSSHVVPEDIHRQQRWWTDACHKAKLDAFKVAVPLRDQCRLRLQTMPHTTAWMQVVPNEGLRLSFSGSEYRILLRWWLGIPLLSGDAAQPCPLCSEPMDAFGDHLVNCSKNHKTERHNNVRNALADVLKTFGVSCDIEVPLPFRLERPGDISLSHFDARGPLLVDLTAHHPLAPSLTRSTESCAASLLSVENAKVTKYESDCASAGMLFSPLGFHLWGGMGPMGSSLLNRIVKQIVGDSQGWIKIHEAWQCGIVSRMP